MRQPTAAFTTLGCKVNQYETQRILDDFEERGFAITEFNTPADIYVINTCSVTQAAERKSRHMVRKAASQNPGSIIVMTGCYGEMAQIKGESVEEAALIVPNHQKLETLSQFLRAYPEFETRLAAKSDFTVPTFVRRTRATLKVQDGCNVFCSFCSIPYTRKYMVSRPLDEILAEAAKRAAQGFREIVVTGVLVGAYGREETVTGVGCRVSGVGSSEEGAAKKEEGRGKREEVTLQHPTLDTLIAPQPPIMGESPYTLHPTPYSLLPDTLPPDLPDCLLALAQVPGIERVRLSSIEPTQVTDKLLDAFAGEPKLCRHLHIPLQSGDSRILGAMNRPYDQAFYLERCRAAYSRIPDLAITSDIMVGFPGEDRAAFESTLHVAREVGFARAHLFRYSPRPNTPAADFADQIEDSEKEARSRELAAACRETQARFIQKFIGRELEVLVEGKEGRGEDESDAEANGRNPKAPRNEIGVSGNDGHQPVNSLLPEASNPFAKASLLSGYTSNYIRVQFTGGSHLCGKVVKVRLLEPSLSGAIGEVGGAHFGPHEAPPDADFIPLATFSATI